MVVVAVVVAFVVGGGGCCACCSEITAAKCDVPKRLFFFLAYFPFRAFVRHFPFHARNQKRDNLDSSACTHLVHVHIRVYTQLVA